MYSRHELEMHADQLDQMAGRDGDAFDTAAKMLRRLLTGALSDG